MARVWFQVQARRRDAPPQVLPAPHAAPGLADVVRRAQPVGNPRLVPALRNGAAEERAKGDRATGEKPLPRSPAPLHPRDPVRLPLHRPPSPRPGWRLVDPQAASPLRPSADAPAAGRRKRVPTIVRSRRIRLTPPVPAASPALSS